MSNQTQTVISQIQSTTVKSQEKYGFNVKDGREQIPFGPFDTRDASDKTRKALADTGVTVSDTYVLWTVATARALTAVRRAKMTPPAPRQSEENKKAEVAS